LCLINDFLNHAVLAFAIVSLNYFMSLFHVIMLLGELLNTKEILNGTIYYRIFKNIFYDDPFFCAIRFFDHE
jgi:hypothetical protein